MIYALDYPYSDRAISLIVSLILVKLGVMFTLMVRVFVEYAVAVHC